LEKSIFMNNQKLGIALAGGGARGIAHIGVLKALEEYGISPQYISGASAGSIIGALYAAGKTPDEMLTIAKETSLFKVFRPGLSLSGLIDISNLQEMLAEQIAEDSFEALPKSLFIAVTNLNTGKWEIIQSGKIFQAVQASSAIPLLFKPVEIDGSVYVDGGVLNNLPVEPLCPNCDQLIGVNVMPHGPAHHEAVDGLVEIGKRCFDLIAWNNSEDNMEQCDVQIDLKGISEYDVFDFMKADEIHNVGYIETLYQMDGILRNLELQQLA